MSEKKYFVFDVESIGLHGEGFAVGFAVIGDDGKIIQTGHYACDPSDAMGEDRDRCWVRENVPSIEVNCAGTKEVRAKFWFDFQKWKKTQNTTIWADCLWPVEANFLSACIADRGRTEEWNGPFPFHEIATAAIIAGRDLDKIQDVVIDITNIPEIQGYVKHHPMFDAVVSARYLVSLL